MIFCDNLVGEDLNLNRLRGFFGSSYAWREVAIYLYGTGVIMFGDLLPEYELVPPISKFSKIAHFVSPDDVNGVYMAMNEDREIVIINGRKDILATIGFLCEV